MSKFIGRKFSVGLGKESVRGTAVAASYWIPKMALTVDDQLNVVEDTSSVAIIEDAIGQDGTTKESSAVIEGIVGGTSFGLIILATLGTEAAPAAVGGDATVYDHVWTVAETAQHQSLTVVAVSPNDNSGNGVRYALSTVDSLEITAEIEKYLMFKVALNGNKSATATNTVSFTAENHFLPQQAVVKLASTYSGLGAASAIQVKKAVITIKKNTEADMVLGSADPVDRLNKQFAIEGSLELTYEDRSYIDTYFMGDTSTALRLQFVNSAVTIGSTSNPTITIDLAKCKLKDVARKKDNNGIVMQTVKFKAFYSLSDSLMVKMTLRNLLSTAY